MKDKFKYIKEFIKLLKSFSNDLEILIKYLNDNKITNINEKERKHRPLIEIDNFLHRYPIEIEIITDENNNLETIKEINIVYNKKNNKQLKYKEEKLNKFNSSIKNKQNSISIYPIVITDELKRIIDKFENEKKEIESAIKCLDNFLNLEKDKNNDEMLKYLYEYMYNKYILENRIKFYFTESEIKTIFPKEDYIKGVIFSPPMKDYSLYSLLFEENNCILCNCYICVTNSQNETHFYYGNFDFINPKINFSNNKKKLLEYLFDKHIKQNNCRLPNFFSTVETKFNLYEITNGYDNILAESFCCFLKLIFKKIKYINDIKICPYSETKFENNILVFGKTHSGIKIIIEINNNNTFKINNKILEDNEIFDEKKEFIHYYIEKKNSTIKIFISLFEYNHNKTLKILENINNNFIEY